MPFLYSFSAVSQSCAASTALVFPCLVQDPEETHFQQVLRTCRFWAEPLNHSGSVSLVPQNSFYSTKGWSYQAITTPSLGAVFASEVEPSAGQEQSCRDSQQKFPGPRSAACGGFALNQTLRLKGPCFGFGRRHTYPEYGA